MASTPPPSPVTTHPERQSWIVDHTPFFYGWMILLVGTLGIVMMGPSQTFTFTIFVDYFVADLNVSRSTLSLLYGIATLGASFLMPVTGRMVDRFGTRRMMVVVTLGLGLACIAMAHVNGLLALFLGLLSVRFMGFGSMNLVSNNVIAQWFIRRRGLVMGVSGQSLAISLLIFPALSDYFITLFGWRGAWIALGAVVWLVMLPLGWVFFRDRPELYGLQPDGVRTMAELHTTEDSPMSGSAVLVNEENWTLEEAMSTAVFWLFAVGFTALSMIMAGLVFHQVSLFAMRGLEQTIAVRGLQVMALTSIVGNLAMGHLLDHFSARRLLLIVLVMAGGALVLVQIMNSVASAMVFATLMGLMSGSYRVMDATIWAKYYGRRHLGAIRGATMLGTVGGTALGAYPLGLSFDLLGSYNPALTTFLLLPFGIGLFTLFARRPAKER